MKGVTDQEKPFSLAKSFFTRDTIRRLEKEHSEKIDKMRESKKKEVNDETKVSTI